MTRLVWGAPGEKFFEGGVDRGVLFVGTAPGVPWNGLTSVTESPSGGEAEPHYFEGYKYDNRANPEQFEGTIDAFTYPDEFAGCDGTGSLGLGLFVGQQRRRPFGLTYRTKVGNDIAGLDKAYKLHIVYNMLATPSSRAYASVNASPSPTNFSWKFTTKPPRVSGIRPSAHFVLDSRKAPQSLMSQIEDTLYGTESTASRLVAAEELMYIITISATGAYDSKTPYDKQYFTLDGGLITEAQDIFVNGGGA